MKTKDTRFGLHRLMLLAALGAALLATCFAPLAHAQDLTSSDPPAATAAATPDIAPAVASITDAPAAPIAAETAASLTWQQSLIVVLTPLIIAGLKKAVPSVPPGILPFLAPICGVLLEVISHLTTGSTLNAWAAVALGAAGVGLREAVKQAKNAAAPAA